MRGGRLEWRHHSRPIDYAYEDGKVELCEVLAKPREEEREVGGLPEPMLDELFGSRIRRDE